MTGARPHRRPSVVVVTGIPGAGKTTVAASLARSFERGVHLEADSLQRCVVAGGVWPHQGPRDEATRQLELRGRNAGLLADSFVAAGFSVVIDDVCVGARMRHLPRWIRSRPLALVVLAPNLNAIARRDAGRRPEKQVFELWAHLDGVLREQTPRWGLWLDTSSQTAEETTQEILRRVEREGAIFQDASDEFVPSMTTFEAGE